MNTHNNLKKSAPPRTPDEWVQIIEETFSEQSIREAVGSIIWYDIFARYTDQVAECFYKYIDRPFDPDVTPQMVAGALVRLGINADAVERRIFTKQGIARGELNS